MERGSIDQSPRRGLTKVFLEQIPSMPGAVRTGEPQSPETQQVSPDPLLATRQAGVSA